MEAVLHPRFAPPDRVRVWLGVRMVTTAPALSWALNGKSITPTAIRLLTRARPAGLLTTNAERVFTGIYEFPDLAPDKSYTINVAANNGIESTDHEIVVRTLPDELPGGTEGWTHILLVSCYHYATCPRNVLEQVLLDIDKSCKPSLSLLLGDQVYLDLPTLKDFPKGAADLAAKFEIDYARNWFEDGGYREVLAAAPSVAIPDDHEYWNNFPHASPFIENSWKKQDRLSWQSAARALFDSFQAHNPATVGDETIIELPPISIFVADTRTQRREDAKASMSPASLARLGAWVDRLNASNQFGIFVSGQSIFDPPADAVGGAVGDKTLANYGDFSEITSHLSRAESPLICITGDVHWGRVTQARDQWRMNRVAFYEIITSPASLVETVGADQWSDAKNWIGGIFGRRDLWPHHAPPHTETAWQGSPASRFECALRHGHRGNQVAVLSLRRFGNGVQARVGYFSLHPQAEYRTVAWSETFDLTAGMASPF